MRKLRQLFGEPAFAVLLALLGFALINWPFVEPVGTAGELALFRYFFAVWSGIVVCAFLIAGACGRAPEDDDV